jgi:hypothetical protein
MWAVVGSHATAPRTVDVLDVVAGGLGRDTELVRDLSIGQAEREESEYFGLTSGEAGRELRTRRSAVPGRVENPFDGFTIELTGRCHGPQFDCRVGGCQGGSMRAICAHRLIAVRRGDDALSFVEVRSVDAPVVAGPVERARALLPRSPRAPQ